MAMTEQRIGGHENYDVLRVPADPALFDGDVPETMVIHRALDEHNAAGLRAEQTALLALRGTGMAPEWLVTLNPEGGSLDLYETDLGDTQPYIDGEDLRHAIVWLLASIRAAGLRHGDTTGANLIVSEDGRKVQAIDWQESHLLSEPAPQKQPWTDSWMLMRFLAEHPNTDGIADTPRIARRWMAVLEDLGAMRHDDANPLPLAELLFSDYGCYEGDFTALAACEGMVAHGYDMGGFRSGGNSIETGMARWSDYPWERLGGAFGLTRTDLYDWLASEAWATQNEGTDVAMCFSTWIYLAEQRSREEAEAWLARLIGGSGVLYFETQLHGDGPGPEWHPDDAAVHDMLVRLGGVEVKPIVTIPVTGRDAARTVWAVR